MTIFTTNSNEADLFLKLVGQGQHPETPFYQSVEKHSCNEGIVTFRRLDCCPSQLHRVVVAGNKIATTEIFSHHINSLLFRWEIRATYEKKSVDSKEDVYKLLSRIRDETKHDRDIMLKKILKELDN
jgi:hypothetical protein